MTTTSHQSLRDKIDKQIMYYWRPNFLHCEPDLLVRLTRDAILTAFSEEIEGMRKETKTCRVPGCTRCHDIKAEGYNQALSDLEERIRK